MNGAAEMLEWLWRIIAVAILPGVWLLIRALRDLDSRLTSVEHSVKESRVDQRSMANDYDRHIQRGLDRSEGEAREFGSLSEAVTGIREVIERMDQRLNRIEERL